MKRVKTIHLVAFAAVILSAVIGSDIPSIKIALHEEPQPPQITSVTLSFSGDVIQHMPQLKAASNGDGTYDFSRNFAYIDTLWRSVDFAVVNYETTVSADGKYTGFPCFSSPPDIAKALHASGVRVIGLANNHCCDKGLRGIRKTLSTLDSLGFRTTGTATDSLANQQILILEKGPFRIALLNYTYSTNGIPIPKGGFVNMIDTTRIKLDIQKARHDSSASHVIAFMHWGVEYQRRSNKEQQQLGAWCRANGVDVVVGSHPHVVQEIDTAQRIVYSLGNFISNQQDQYTDSGITVVVKLSTLSDPTIEFLPHWCDKIVSTPKEKYRILTPRDTTMLRGEHLAKMKKALQEARAAVGNANEIKL